MFDKTVLIGGGSSHHTHHTTVTEKRAPTDESLRLLNEMREKVLDDILARVLLDFGGIKAQMFIMRNVEINGYRSVTMLNVNGKDLRITVDIPFHIEPHKRVGLIRQAVADRITTELLQSAFDTMEDHSKALLLETR